MNKKNKMISMLLMGIFSFNLLTVNAFAIENDPNSNNINMSRRIVDDMPELFSSTYMNNYKVNISKYEFEGEESEENYDISKAFDNSWSTYWQSRSKSITVTFESLSEISRILYGARPDIFTAEGYPTKLKILASETDNGNDFKEITAYESGAINKKLLFTLSKPINAKRIKFVFEESDNGWASAAELIFLKEDSLLNKVDNMFTNNEYTGLKEEYKNEKTLSDMEQESENHVLSDYLIKRIKVAKNLLTGEGNKDELLKGLIDFPVHVIQKKGLDSDKNVLLFMGDGYAEDEQDKFINDIKERVTKLFEIAPFSDYKDEFNIYAMKVVSNESGIGTAGNNGVNTDNYFRIKFNSNGIKDRANFSDSGSEKAIRLVKQFEELYLDKGGKVFHSSFLLNSNTYGCSSFGNSMVSLSVRPNILAHEIVHNFTEIRDEYITGSSMGVNKTKESDPNKISWKEFLGFRGVDIVPYGTCVIQSKIFKPSSSCIMNRNGEEFCEVCKLEIATAFNKDIKNKRELYIAEPIIATELVGHGYRSVGKEITNSNITEANGEKLQYRTVVKNFTDSNKNLKLQLTIIDKDGEVKDKVEKDFVVGPEEVKSLKILTEELNGLTAEDKVEGKVIHNAKDKIEDSSKDNKEDKSKDNKEEKSQPPVINGANDITIKVGEVDKFNSDLLNGITVIDDKDTIDPKTIKVTGQVGKPKAGNSDLYTITYEVSDNNGNVGKASRVITVTNQLPIIEGLNDITIKRGETVDLKAGVTAKDNEDGNLTEKIVLPNVDLSNLNIGQHEIKYTVADSDNNRVTQVRRVNVEANTVTKVDIIGTDRYETASKISNEGWSSANTVILVNGLDKHLIDGLTAAPLASALDAPILLTKNNSLPKTTIDEIRRLNASKVIVIGGTVAISDSVINELRSISGNMSVQRISGQNRYETSLNIAKELDKIAPINKIYVGAGNGEVDSLSISSVAGREKAPIILTSKDSVDTNTYNYLKSKNLSDAYFIGGNAIISDKVIEQVDNIVSKKVSGNRIAGANRRETNAKVIEKFYPEANLNGVIIAKDLSLVDALSVGPLAAKRNQPVVLAQNSLSEGQENVLKNKFSSNLYQAGGGVNTTVLESLKNLLTN